MSDMVERVAKAIGSALKDSPFFNVRANGPNGEAVFKQLCEVLAMDAIEAMREFKTEDFTLPEAAAIRRLFDEALE